MKSNLSIALLSAFSFALVGCAQESTTAPTLSKLVEMPTPSGWTRTDKYALNAGLNADYVLRGQAVGDYRPNIIVVTTPTEGISVDSAGRMLASLAQEDGDLLDSSHAVRIGGVDGWLIQTRQSTSLGEMVERDLLLVYKGKDCQIVLTRKATDTSSEAIFLAEQAAITLN